MKLRKQFHSHSIKKSKILKLNQKQWMVYSQKTKHHWKKLKELFAKDSSFSYWLPWHLYWKWMDHNYIGYFSIILFMPVPHSLITVVLR